MNHLTNVKNPVCSFNRALDLDFTAKLDIRIKYRDEIDAVVRVGRIPNHTGVRADQRDSAPTCSTRGPDRKRVFVQRIENAGCVADFLDLLRRIAWVIRILEDDADAVVFERAWRVHLLGDCRQDRRDIDTALIADGRYGRDTVHER